MNDQNSHRLHTFASLHWYDETIKFVFNFVTKTSELLLAAGVVISTANFLTDGDVMSHNKPLSDAWSWAQALAIDSSLGIVFMNALQAVQERDKFKAIIFFILTALLATVAALITHFDALAHAAGLSVTDKNVSGILPLWVMTALRSLAVIGFLLASRLKGVSVRELRQHWNEKSELPQESLRDSTVAPQIDYTALTAALIEALQQTRAVSLTNMEEQETFALPLLKSEAPSTDPSVTKLVRAYEILKEERAKKPNPKPISARELAQRANVRRSTCSAWLQQQAVTLSEEQIEEERTYHIVTVALEGESTHG